MRELQQAFLVVADALIEGTERQANAAMSHREEREAWESRLLELDTINRSHIEHLDRRFHDLNLWQQRVESLVTGALIHEQSPLSRGVFVATGLVHIEFHRCVAFDVRLAGYLNKRHFVWHKQHTF